jgi:hypothetical protein
LSRVEILVGLSNLWYNVHHQDRNPSKSVTFLFDGLPAYKQTPILTVICEQAPQIHQQPFVLPLEKYFP